MSTLNFADWKKEFHELARSRNVSIEFLSEVRFREMALQWEWSPKDALECVLEYEQLLRKAERDRVDVVSVLPAK